MPQPLGKLTIIDPRLAKPIEIDTVTCCHCNKVVKMNDASGAKVHDVTAWCFRCGAMICAECGGRPCVPLEKAIEELEKRDRDRRASAAWG